MVLAYENCVRFFPLDEASGDRICLVSGKKLQVVGTDAVAAGFGSYANSYSTIGGGTANYLTDELNYSSFVGNNQWYAPACSYSIWINRRGNTAGTIYVGGTYNSYESFQWDNSWNLYISVAASPTINFMTGNGMFQQLGTLAIAGYPAYQTWNNVIFTYRMRDKFKQIFVNGTLRASGIAAHLSRNIVSNVGAGDALIKTRIGKQDTGTTADVYLQQILMYRNTEMTATDATWMYNGGTGRTTAEIQAATRNYAIGLKV